MMSLTVITQPTVPSVPSLEEVKAHLRTLDFNDDDGDIQSKIWGAIIEFEDPALGILGRSIVRRQVEVSFDEFSACLDLPYFPVLSGEDNPLTVKYDDGDGVEQTVADTVYRILDADNSACRLVLKSSQSWPSSFNQEQAVRVRFWTGYAADDVRINNFKSAVKLHVQMTYDGDPEEKLKLSQTINRLLSIYWVPTV